MSTALKETYFLLFPTCIPVRGHANSLIMDLDNGAFIEIPNLLQEILSSDLKNNTIQQIKSIFKNKYDEGIDNYFQYLANNEYGFFTQNPAPFQKPEQIFYSPFKVISSILEYDQSSAYDIADVLSQLETLSCQIIQIRLYDFIAISQLSKLLDNIKESDIRIIEIMIPMNEQLVLEELKLFMINYPRVRLIIYNSQSKKRVVISENPKREIVYSEHNLNKGSKEIYSIKSFTINHQMYYEALQYNTGLHRKVCIDTEGNIKNYLSHKKSYGNTIQDRIEDVINQNDFQKKYHIHNDMIEKCKDCQFRYMCLSNSDVKFSNNSHHKIQSCNFDPYTNSWN
ncbi:grasp-with-spasm system SPASM domain peptide maturase [Aquimarina sp. D1M17]|uniref:grasp-with-spasm system SPASM domain peptide maturase n=1 Tax=Aquimarina acroporae TaxID=2937283 RepID=UPI0020BDBA34|nr:grasp-with-spasm system SPASM domain peptide maturase [Aquimarina acroporae]MCK8522515.1 grasp-with-spasm system SPASM domain peptide maturase [Aquimarina acroporae]